MDEVQQLLADHDALLAQKRTKAVRTQLNKVKEKIGVAVAKAEAAKRFGADRIRYVGVPIRKNKVDILDLLIELDDGRLALVEAKCSTWPLGRTNDARVKLVRVEGGVARTTPLVLQDTLQQLDALWIKDRIAEIRKQNVPLADRLEAAYRTKTLQVLEMRTRVELTDAGSRITPATVTDHTPKVHAQMKVGGRFVGDEHWFARQESLSRLYAESFAEDAELLRKKQQRVQRELRKAQTALRNAEAGFNDLVRKHAIEARKLKIAAARREVLELTARVQRISEEIEQFDTFAREAKREAREYGRFREGKKQQKFAEEAAKLAPPAPPITDVERGLVEQPKKPPAHLTRPDAPDIETPKAKPVERYPKPQDVPEDESKPVERQKPRPEPDAPKKEKAIAGAEPDEPKVRPERPGPGPEPEPSGEADPGRAKHQPKSTRAIEGPATSEKAVRKGDALMRDVGDPMTGDRMEVHRKPAGAPKAPKVAAAAEDVADVGKLTRRARVTEYGLKGLRVVGKAGKLVFRVLNFANPVFDLLAAVEVIDRLVAFLRRKEIEEQKEWRRLAEFFFDPPKTVTNIYGIEYKTSIRDAIDGILKWQIVDEARTNSNILFWYEKWLSKKWDGFVYAYISAEIEKQVTTSDVPYQTKYYWSGPVTAEFATRPKKNFRNERRKSGTRLGSGDEGNYSTHGRGKYRYDPDYTIDVDPFYVTVGINYPQPYLTPFDFIQMKCETLIANIISFAAIYDPNIVEGMSVSDTILDGVKVFWFQDARLAPPLNTENIVACLWVLDRVIDLLNTHAHHPADARRSKLNASYTNGYYRRLKLLQGLAMGWSDQTPKAWPGLKGRRVFDFMRGPLINLLNRQECTPEELADMNAMSELASSIDDDLRRVFAACKGDTSVKFNYEAVVPA